MPWWGHREEAFTRLQFQTKAAGFISLICAVVIATRGTQLVPFCASWLQPAFGRAYVLGVGGGHRMAEHMKLQWEGLTVRKKTALLQPALKDNPPLPV